MERQDFKKWLLVRTDTVDTTEPVNEILGTLAMGGAAAYAASRNPWVQKKWNALKKAWSDEPDATPPPAPAPTPPPAPSPPPNPREAPEDPEHWGEHQLVKKYYHMVLSDMMLDGNHNIVDASGQPITDIPPRIEKVFKNYIASHVLEGKSSRLRISFQNAAEIIKFLDNLKVDGESESLADRFDVSTPKGLTRFVQSSVDASPNLRYQDDYDRRVSKKKDPGQSLPPPSVWEDPEVKEVLGFFQPLLPVLDKVFLNKGGRVQFGSQERAQLQTLINKIRTVSGGSSSSSTNSGPAPNVPMP